MFLKWFHTRAAAEVGVALANEFVPKAGSKTPAQTKGARAKGGADLQGFLQRVDQQAGPLKLGWLGRAKLANAFKWRLREIGVDAPMIDELTHVLLLRLSAPGQAGVAQSASARKR